MADVSINFFWPELILSIVLSILLTVGLNVWAHHKSVGRETCEDAGFSPANRKEESGNTRGGFDFETPRSKTGGMIMIGPIPIVFGDGGFRFDKKTFKYALLFFIILIISCQFLIRTVRL